MTQTIRVLSAANDNADNGVCTHSGSALWEPFVIFAIDAASNGKDDRQAMLGTMQFKLWCVEREAAVVELIGCYKGQREPAFIMRADDFTKHRVETTWCAGQESVLYLSSTRGPAETGAGYRFADLLFKDGTTKDLGRWHRVNATDAMGCDSWTYQPEDGWGGGGYWIAGEVAPAAGPGRLA